MKTETLRELKIEELVQKLADLKREFHNLRFQKAVGQLANPKSITFCRKEIARVKTVIRERELNIGGSK